MDSIMMKDVHETVEDGVSIVRKKLTSRSKSTRSLDVKA